MNTMPVNSRALVPVALALVWPVTAGAVGFEIDLHAGRTAPTFEQTLTYDPSASIPNVPGVSLRPLGPLQMEAKGALAFSGGVTLFFAGPLGIEGRIDGLEADLATAPAGYDVTAAAQPPLPGFSARLDLLGEDLKIERVLPVSLNLRLVTPGSVRFSISGGISRLGTINVGGALAGALRVDAGGFPLPVATARVSLVAAAPPDEADRGRYGLNAGVGLQIGLGANLALSGEVRGFLFKERVLTWSAGAPPSNVVEEAVQQELLARLEPIRFTPTFFSANVGLALRF